MKTLKSSLYFLLLLSLALTFAACEKEVNEPTETICETDDPDEALIAFFDPYSGTIYVTAEVRDEIAGILNLEAIPSSDQPFYLYQTFTMRGDIATVEVQIEVAALEEVIAIADAVDRQLETDVDTYPEGVLVSSSRTRKGYVCEKVGDARTTRCHVFPNHSSNSRYYDRYICAKGPSSSTCSDWSAVVGYAYEYYDRDCAGDPNNQRALKGYTCR
jgi:hypothetical protein